VSRTLYAKLALVLTFIVAGVGALLLVLTLRTQRMYLEETNQRLYAGLARDVLDRLEGSAEGLDADGLRPQIEILMRLDPRLELYLLDAAGRIVLSSAPPGRVRLERVDPAPIEALLAGAELPVRGDDPRDPGRQRIFSAARLQDGRGYLYVILEGEPYRSLLSALATSRAVRLAVLGAAALTLVGLTAGLLLFRAMTRPLSQLAEDMERFEQNTMPASEDGDDGSSTAGEIERVRQSFGRLAARVSHHLGELRHVDDLRRELVANVSHDLRRPLSVVQGYLDTLSMMEESLGTEERHRYLEAAGRHLATLDRRVSELLELARLESGERAPALEPFHLGELLQDVARKFEIDASQRGIHIEVRPSPEPLLAHADIGLVERTLENLLDNALRHTPTGGRIELRARRDGPWVVTEVSDTGPGIPAEAQAYVFDRFYRGGRPEEGRGGMGLGLAIVRRIVELHGGSVSVESGPTGGSTFAFRLPAAGDPPRNVESSVRSS
jgi:two-component system OmpR family sensor kinase